MRILFVGRNSRIGGGTTFRLNLGRGLIQRGHEVHLASLGGAVVDRCRRAGIGFHWAPPYPLFASVLAGVVRRHRIDLVHASNTSAGDVALLACQRTGVPLVVSLHNTIATHEAEHPCLKAARRVVVFDEGAAKSARKFREQFDTGKIVVSALPLDCEPVAQEELSPVHVAYVGRLSSRKGRVALTLLDGFEAFARETPGARLTVLGGGSLLSELRQRAARMNGTAAAVDIRGEVLDPQAHLRTAGVIVGAGYAALEGMMQGRAVIGAGFNGYGLVTHANAVDALACNFGDTVRRWEVTPENFLQALRTARDAWSTPATRMDLWGLDRVAAPRHSIPVVAEQMERIYREALEG